MIATFPAKEGLPGICMASISLITGEFYRVENNIPQNNIFIKGKIPCRGLSRKNITFYTIYS
ncbi:MAG: hypothetical protein IKB25_11480 [Lentisphaeria bacterium]|nr:hypothetical protein [Lentisphaeria bacterium]